ncbi:MAG TPA: response regulator [Rudaea sp.]
MSKRPPSAGSPVYRSRAAVAPKKKVQRILVVDDEPDFARSLILLLGMWGYGCMAVHQAAQAEAIALTYKPDVALIDLRMPDMDGETLAARFTQNAQLAGTALIAVSGYLDREDERRLKDSGFTESLQKPLPMDCLEYLLDEIGRRAA